MSLQIRNIFQTKNSSWSPHNSFALQHDKKGLVNDYLDDVNYNLKLKGIQLYKKLAEKFSEKAPGDNEVEKKY